jgi:hypothetical protein
MSGSGWARPPVAGRAFMAAPPAVTQGAPAGAAATTGPQKALTLYSIGNPTDAEQYWLELVNYERANPQAEAEVLDEATDPYVVEAYSYFGVDLSAMVAAFASIKPAPPLSMNAELLASARGHSADMLANTYEGHTGSNGSTPAQRIAAAGYDAATEGENVYAFASSVFDGNASFEVDWGVNPPTGMQDPPGHRENDHDGVFAEVGIGVTDGIAFASGIEYGPLLCTMDFGTQTTNTPFVTGVVYYDVGGSGVYEMGDGLGGVAVNVSGASFSASTANSGGYSVPASGAGTRTVTFSLSGTTNQQVTTTLSGTSNVKVDLKLTYTPPVVSGPANPLKDQESTYRFSALPGASSYQYKQARLVPFTAIATGANGTSDFTVDTSGGYSVVASDETFGGAPSFHLAHVDPDEQVLTLNVTLIPNAASALQFQSLLGYATATEVAGAQVSADGGDTWHGVWSQAGTGGAGDASFNAQSIPLSQYAGKEIIVRFVYVSTGSTYYNTANTGVGFYIDNIQVTNAAELTGAAVTTVTGGTSFSFEPTATGTFALAVRAQAVSRSFPWGPDDIVDAVAAAPTAPTVATNPASPVGATMATLNGAVNPNGAATAAEFQWGLDTNYGNSTAAVSLGSGPASVTTRAKLSTLTPGTTYHFRLTGSNALGRVDGGDLAFTTAISFAGYTAKYVGLIGTGGIITVTVGANGAFTAGGKLGGTRFGFAGQFNGSGEYAATLKNGMQVQLQLVMEQVGVVSGTIASGAASNSITLDPAAENGTVLTYTFRLPHPSGTGLPQGNGYGAMRMPGRSTAANFAGKLGDGTPIAFGSSVVIDGTSKQPIIPVYLPLYGGKGSVSGVLARETTVNGDLDGAVNWIKPATTGTFLPSPFETQVNLYGSLYVKPPAGQRVIDVTNGTVIFNAGGLANAPLQYAVTLGTNNKVTVTALDSDKLKMSIRASDGLFGGSFVDPDTGRTTRYAGALIQGGFNLGTGVFKGAAEAGSVDFQ